MKKIAFVFSQAPHGTSSGREGLDSIFSIASVHKKISLFFVDDGVLQLIKSYKTEKILARNYILSFPILSLYDITKFYCCKNSLIDRGLQFKTDFILKVTILEFKFLRLKIDQCNIIINF